jgi:peptidoglycan hydrolase CwlO-like protein
MLVRHSTPELNIQKIIAGYKICPLDHEREKMVQKEIEKWRELEVEIIGVKEDVAEVKKKMTEVEGDVTKVEKEMTGLKQDFTQVKEGLDNLKSGVLLKIFVIVYH